jgi:hypothetical protein
MLSRKKRRSASRPIRRSRRLLLEELENRITPSLLPSPIIPAGGDANLIQQALTKANNGQTAQLNSFPIPFAIEFSGGSAPTQVFNWHASQPGVALDVDQSKVTGKGGNDIKVTVSVVTTPTPHLVMAIDQLGVAPFATNVKVLIAFPFNSLDLSEVLPSGMPNIVIGYQTTAAGGAVGGIAPAHEVITFTPTPPGGLLGGTNHLFNLTFATTGASNPIQFLAGEFDGTFTTGQLDARAISAYVENVPSTINLGLNLAQSALFGGPPTGSVGLTWDATSASKVIFGYTEDITTPTPIADYNTTLTFDQMPTHEAMTLSANETAGTITLSSRSNATIGAITLNTVRRDGLTITGTASGVPTALDLTVGTAGTVMLDTHGTTLGGLTITGQQTGGFINTAGFLGYNIGYVSLALTSVPSLTAGYIPGIDQFGVIVTVPGTSIGSISLVISKDQNLHLPPSGLFSNLNWDIFSLVDDGTTGTAAVRMDSIQQATVNLNPASIDEIFTLITTAPHPMEAYLRTTTTSNLIPGHDVEVTADIINFPAGSINFTGAYPKFSYMIVPPQTIDSVHIFGHIDSTFFDVDAGSLPAVFSIDFDPDSHATIVAQDGMGGQATVGHIAVHLWNPNGTGLSGSGFLFATPLNDARVRFDQIPSLHATWSNAGSTTINFSPDVPTFIAGAQLALSTVFDLPPLPVADPTATDTVELLDQGAGLEKQLDAGAFGISSFTLNTNDAMHQFTLHYAANATHLLTVSIDSALGGRYFPIFHTSELLTIDSIPGSFDFHTDTSNSFVYTASAPIASVSLNGFIDNGLGDHVNTTFLATGLPKNVDFELTGSKQATLTMNDSISHIFFDYSDDTGGLFLLPDYHLVTASMDNIPAHWSADWSGGGLVVEAKDASDNPAPMGVVTATISTSDDPMVNAMKIMPFEMSGPGGARINYSPYLQTIDSRYFGDGAPDGGAATLAALDALYNHAQVLTAGEDHAVARINGGSLDFFDAQFTGFQKIALQPNSNGGHFEFDAPTPGPHPFLAGAGFDANFLVGHIDNIPDSSTLDIDLAAQDIHFHSSASMGTIDVYYGPAGMAQDSDTAFRAVMQDTPTDVHIFWNFGFPSGSANFVASNQFTMLFLSQNGSNRITAAARLQELQAGYNIAFDPHFSVGTTYGIPTSLDLVLLDATAGIDNDVNFDGGGNPIIAANPSKPGVDGFFSLYRMKSTNADDVLTPAGPAAGPNEYVPELTFQMKDFREFSFHLSAGVHLFPAFLDPFIDTHGGPTIVGQFNLDLWAGKVDITTSLFGFDFGFLNAADWTDNTPIHIIPLGSPTFNVLHDAVFTFVGFNDHSSFFDPLA